MDGVNNAFCMSKEEYELARLATKCAGLEGERDKYKALCDQIGNALLIARMGLAYHINDVDLAIESWRKQSPSLDSKESIDYSELA